jgi:hypothetical protein
MSKRMKWSIGAGLAAGIAAAYFSLGHSGGSSASQRVNALLDDAQALGIRILELPLFMLLAAVAVAGAGAVVLVEKSAARRLKTGRIALATAAIVALFTLAFAADRHNTRLQNQISDLRGKLNSQRMAAIESPEPATAPASPPAAAVIAAAGNSASAPAAASAPASAAAVAKPAAAGARDKQLIDVEAIKTALTAHFANPALRAVILDRASDAVEIRIANPQMVAYVSITDLKAPGVEIQCGGNTTLKTFTSDFARTSECSIAINGEAGQSPQANSGFGLWYGNMVSNGRRIITETPTNPRPFLSFDKQSQVSYTAQVSRERALPAEAWNVVWGRWDAILDGAIPATSERDRQPRTAMGISKDGSRLFMMVVDGRQQQYSVGATKAEVGMLLNAFGAYNGMMCDEGGSSCMYLKKFNSIVNSPSDGVERATYTHFGITLRNPSAPAPPTTAPAAVATELQ